jgi:hypothetical protein
MDLVDFKGDSVILSLAQLDVEQSPDSAYHLVTERVARGADPQSAEERARHIRSSFSWNDDVLSLSNLYSIPARDKMRAQHVNYVLQVPLGGRVHFAPGTETMMHDWLNGDAFDHDFGSDLDSDMAGRTWTMTRDGLKPVDQEKEKEKVPQPVSERRAPVQKAVASVLMTDAASAISVPVPNLIELLTAGLRP